MFSVNKKDIIFLKRSKVINQDTEKINKRKYLRVICTMAVECYSSNSNQ